MADTERNAKQNVGQEAEQKSEQKAELKDKLLRTDGSSAAVMAFEQVPRCFAAYDLLLKPLCHELGIPRSAFDILMLLADNPQCKAARDIVEKHRLKPNLVSVNVDRLVNMGYLERKPVEDDRRKIELICTSKADEAVERGRAFRRQFQAQMLEGVSEADLKVFQRVVDAVDANLSNILASGSASVSKGDDAR